MDKKNNRVVSKIGLLLVSLFLVLFIAEILLHALIRPSEISFGRVLGRDLPPFKVLEISQMEEQLSDKQNEAFSGVGAPRSQLTNGDIWGIMQEDAILGYKPKENAVSHNGWWRSNDLGARSGGETARSKPENDRRVLLFGDSYTQGWGVPTNQTLDYFLNEKSTQAFFENFGVAGYGLAQTYLRYHQIKYKLDFEGVVMIFVPTADLGRDINVIRSLAFNWSAYKPQPRFVLSGDGELILIPPFYEDLNEMIKSNKSGISKDLKEHLYKYDRFYSKLEHEAIPFLDRSIIFKMFKKKLITYARAKNKIENLMNPSSEAMRVSKVILRAMREDVVLKNKFYILVILPKERDLSAYRNGTFKQKWDDMVESICSEVEHCLDLMGPFEAKYVQGQIDASYDNTHYGPKTNRIFADELWKFIKEDRCFKN